MDLIQQEITGLLYKWSHGDGDALEQLVPVIYPELRHIARRYMQRENAGHTLQTSALVNEAFLRLVDQQKVVWQNRSHFFAVAARVMRHILIDHARKYKYDKRGGGARHLPLDDVPVFKKDNSSEFVELDEALDRLGHLDQRKLQIVELRFFVGLTIEEVAEVLGLSAITIKREWRLARAWLYIEMSRKSI